MGFLNAKNKFVGKGRFSFSSPWLVPILLVLVTLLVFLNSFPSVFVMDDLHIVVNNPFVKSFDLKGIFTSDYWHGIEKSGLYRPFTIFSFALNRLVTGSAAWGFHLVNVLLHAGVSVLMWLTLRRWLISPLAAVTAALLFAVHPLHTEVINEVVGRSELLAALFLLLALLVAQKTTRFTFVAVLSFYFLALLSKEHAIVLLALLPLFDLFSAGPERIWRRRWPLYVGLLGMTVGWLLLRLYGVQDSGPPSNYSPISVPLAYLPWDERILTGLQYQGVYLLKLLIPYKLQAAYSLADLPQPVASIWSLRGILVLTGTLAVITSVVVGWRRRQLWALFMACYFVSFAPTANVVIPIGVTFAERLAYLPSIWFCAITGIFVQGSLDLKRLKNPFMILLTLYLLLFSAITIMRNNDFASEIRLWSEEVRINPNDYLGWLTFAEVLNNSKRYEEAERSYRHVLELQPDFQGALRSYVFFLVTQKRYVEALEPANRTLELSRKQQDEVGIAHDLVGLGQVYIELEEYDKGLKLLLSPEATQVVNRDMYYSLLGRAHEGQGDYSQAVTAYRLVDRHVPEQKIDFHLGLCLLQLGRLDEARIVLEDAVRGDGTAEEWNLLGTIAAQRQDYTEAVEAFSRAVQLAESKQRYQENLDRARQLLNSTR